MTWTATTSRRCATGLPLIDAPKMAVYGHCCRDDLPIILPNLDPHAAMKNRKQLGVGLFTGMIIGIIADNLVMGIGIGLAIGIAMSFESKG